MGGVAHSEQLTPLLESCHLVASHAELTLFAPSVDVDPYIDGGNGAQWYNDTNNFYRAVRNFVTDVTAVAATTSATGIHWQVSQGTSLYNVQFKMSTASDTVHQGLWMENGSGGMMGGAWATTSESTSDDWFNRPRLHRG